MFGFKSKHTKRLETINTLMIVVTGSRNTNQIVDQANDKIKKLITEIPIK